MKDSVRRILQPTNNSRPKRKNTIRSNILLERMLKAKDLLNLTHISYKTNKEYIKKILFFCPECGKRVIFIDSFEKIKHFRHKVKTLCQNSSGETQEHLEMKIAVMKILETDPLCTNFDFEIKIGDRIADVYCERQGLRFVIECQHSRLSYEAWKAR